MAKATKFERLVTKADDAGKIRRYSVNPDVVALRVERVMTGSTALFWFGLVAGLGFTVPNVAHFMGYGFGWLVSPAINAPLIALLIAGSIMARYDEKPSWGVQVAKWVLMGFEYGMNTWTAYAAQDATEVFKHSVPMIIVVLCAECITDLRAALTRCVAKAYNFAAQGVENVETVAEIAEKTEVQPVVETEPAPVEIVEVQPVVEEIAPVEIVTETKYRPEGGTRAAKHEADMSAMKEEFGDGIAFLLLSETDRMKKVRDLFSSDEKKCGNSRAYRLAQEFSKKIESELRSDVS